MEKVLTEATQPIWSFLAGLKKMDLRIWSEEGAPACQRPTRCSDSAASWRVNRTQGGGLSTVEKFAAIGVDEIACLIDFGIDYDSTMDGLKHLAGLADLISAAGRRKPVPASARF
jgi:hypothetical protein